MYAYNITCVYVYIYIYIHRERDTYIYTCIHTCTYIYIYTYIHVYVYIYIYMYIHTYICIYTYTYHNSMYASQPKQRRGVAPPPRTGRRRLPNATPNPPTNIVPTSIARLRLSGSFPTGMRIPSLRIEIMLESNPLKPTMLVGRLGVLCFFHAICLTGKLIGAGSRRVYSGR